METKFGAKQRDAIPETRKAGGGRRQEIPATRKGPHIAYPLRRGRPITIVGLAIVVFAGILSAYGSSNLTSRQAFANTSTADSLSASFSICGDGRHINCVVDGDTFCFEGGEHLVEPPRCEAERLKGEAAKARLLALLNAGTLSTGVRDEDKYGRKLRTVTRAGRSLGSTLVHEDLARSWHGRDTDGVTEVRERIITRLGGDRARAPVSKANRAVHRRCPARALHDSSIITDMHRSLPIDS